MLRINILFIKILFMNVKSDVQKSFKRVNLLFTNFIQNKLSRNYYITQEEITYNNTNY